MRRERWRVLDCFRRIDAVMSIDTTKLLNDALSLPAEARAALAAKLIESLDETVDPDAEALWA